MRATFLNRVLFFLFADLFLSFMTLFFSYSLRFNFSIPESYSNFYIPFMFLIVLKVVVFYLMRLYFISWKYFSFIDVKRLFIAHSVVYLIYGMAYFITQNHMIFIPKSILIMDFFLSFLFLSSIRGLKRFLIENSSTNYEKAIIIGANSKTSNLIRLSQVGELNYLIKEIFDDDGVGNYILGIKVNSIKNLSNLSDIKNAIITKNLSQNDLDELVDFLTNKGVVNIKLYSQFENRLKNLSIEDLLARKPKDLDKKVIEEFVKGKTVLITGAGGSIGSELARQCQQFNAKKIILVDACEYNLYKIAEEVEGENILINILDENFEKIFKNHNFDLILHTAAFKHVPMCEQNPDSCIKNNIASSKKLFDLAVRYKVPKVVNISTDKAVRPTNIMGATKRVIELYAQNIKSENTDIVSVRFGNVLGSSGSVIPKFKELIEKNQNLTVTHPEITRYFMLISEACSLVLQAGAIAKKRELFILDMGEPVKIADLAQKMIALSGKNLDIEYIGLRAGEKLYEELLINDSDLKTKYSSILIVEPTYIDINTLNSQIEGLLAGDLTKLQKIVPEFKHNKNS